MSAVAIELLNKLAPYIIGAILLAALVTGAFHWRNAYAEKRLEEYRLQLTAESDKIKAKAIEDAHIAEVRSLKLNEMIEVQTRENNQANAELSTTVQQLNAERVRRYQAAVNRGDSMSLPTSTPKGYDGADSEAYGILSAEADRQAAEDARDADRCSESLRAAQSFGKSLITQQVNP